MKAIGFVDYFLDEWHANHYVQWLEDVSRGELRVRYAYARIDSPNGGMTTDQWCRQFGVERAAAIQELVEKSDCIIVLAPGSPQTHEELCALPLRSGKRVYVDKTFAETRAAAEGLFALAQAHGTPCFSASALRYAPELRTIPQKEAVGLISVGPGPLGSYSIHQIEPIIVLMGVQVSRVMFTGTEALPAFVLEYRDGRRAFFSHHGWDCPFAMTVDLEGGGCRRFTVQSDYFAAFMADVADFFLSGTPKVAPDETIAIIAVREAVLRSVSRPGEWVSVPG